MASNAPICAQVKPDPHFFKYKGYHKKETNGLVADTRSKKEESHFHNTSVLICIKTPVKGNYLCIQCRRKTFLMHNEI